MSYYVRAVLEHHARELVNLLAENLDHPGSYYCSNERIGDQYLFERLEHWLDQESHGTPEVDGQKRIT